MDRFLSKCLGIRDKDLKSKKKIENVVTCENSKNRFFDFIIFTHQLLLCFNILILSPCYFFLEGK